MTDIPASFEKIQQEALQLGKPVSEATWQAMGGAINGLLTILAPVGTVVPSFLDESTFQGQTSTDWVLADGRSALGTNFNTLTGLSTVPDLRGVGLRGKNYTRNASFGNADGDVAVGTYQGDQYASHTHTMSYSAGAPSGYFATGRGNGNDGDQYETGVTNVSANNSGGNETRMRNVTVNYFVRIN